MKYESSTTEVIIQYVYFFEKTILLITCFRQEQPIEPRKCLTEASITNHCLTYEGDKIKLQYMVVISGLEHTLISETFINHNIDNIF